MMAQLFPVYLEQISEFVMYAMLSVGANLRSHHIFLENDMIFSLGTSSTCEVCNKQCNIEKELETCICGQKHASVKSGRHIIIWVSNDHTRKKNLHGSGSFIGNLYYVYQLCTHCCMLEMVYALV